MAQSSQDVFSTGILKNWKNGFNRILQHSIIPPLQHSICSLITLFARSSAFGGSLPDVPSGFQILDCSTGKSTYFFLWAVVDRECRQPTRGANGLTKAGSAINLQA
jgi:hypothetical protein